MRSIGLALTDTLDDLISDERINPQLAMKILSNFDQAITESLQRTVKNRLSFKVGTHRTYLSESRRIERRRCWGEGGSSTRARLTGVLVQSPMRSRSLLLY